MTADERALLLEVAHRLAFHIENEFSHLPGYKPGEITSTITRLEQRVSSDAPVYHANTTDKEP